MLTNGMGRIRSIPMGWPIEHLPAMGRICSMAAPLPMEPIREADLN